MDETNNASFANLSSASSAASRKRPRENETPSQRQKREKAAERQRRKRERDRNASSTMGMIAYPPPSEQHHHHHHHHPQPPTTPPPSQPTQSEQSPSDLNGQDLSPDEVARRDRVRAAARDRQRKHRQMVKQRKLRELGLDMGNDVMPGMDEVHYRVNPDGQYQQVLPHELQNQQHAMSQHEPPFPQGQPMGGQTFASTLLLSFSCAPLLKQHLLRTLSMTNEELASLEPIIAEAWEHWDHQRRLQQFAEQAAKATIPGGPSAPSPYVEMNEAPPPPGSYTGENGAQQQQQQQQPPPTDFRARFHRSLVAPSPFRNFGSEAQAAAAATTTTNANTSASTTASNASTTGSSNADPIDPHLASATAVANAIAAAGESSRAKSASTSIDPDLGQARGEAEGVVGRLERG